MPRLIGRKKPTGRRRRFRCSKKTSRMSHGGGPVRHIVGNKKMIELVGD
jgi:hypothetical protein